MKEPESEIIHQKDCTWLRHVKAGEVAPGQTFWGRLNYGWCQSFCERPIAQIDFVVIYEDAHGKWKWFGLHRLIYNRLVKRAIAENSQELKREALMMAGCTSP